MGDCGLFFQNFANGVINGNFPATYAFIIFLVWSVYETAILYAIDKVGHSKQVNLIRYVNAAIETTLPSVLIIGLFYSTKDPILAMNSPPHMLYFIMITLSILRLSYGLSIFTGFLAMVEYIALAVWVMQSGIPEGLPNYLHSPFPHIGKGIIFLFAGVVAGFVGNQLQKRIVASLESIEERNEIVNMFGSYVSPAVVEKLLEQKSEFESESRHVCVMFLDIRNFTSFSEKRSPAEVIAYLNDFFSHLIDIVNQNNGMVNKFLGDGFMAVFGAPISDGQADVRNAVKASLEMVKRVEQLNRDGHIPPTKIGIGLHAGTAMTGNVGTSERKEYTIIGDTVNLASRVEQLNKEYGSAILVTDSVYEVVRGEFEGKSLPPSRVKGRAEEVQIYQLY